MHLQNANKSPYSLVLRKVGLILIFENESGLVSIALNQGLELWIFDRTKKAMFSNEFIFMFILRRKNPH